MITLTDHSYNPDVSRFDDIMILRLEVVYRYVAAVGMRISASEEMM